MFTFIKSSTDSMNAISASIIWNSLACCLVWEFSALNTGPKLYTLESPLNNIIKIF